MPLQLKNNIMFFLSIIVLFLIKYVIGFFYFKLYEIKKSNLSKKEYIRETLSCRNWTVVFLFILIALLNLASFYVYKRFDYFCYFYLTFSFVLFLFFWLHLKLDAWYYFYFITFVLSISVPLLFILFLIFFN